ncbi:Ubiquitin-conjugating enzyme family protein [Perilla frutescens var. hirtella]|nr:Ubiquitin-conjugating enzyme family protein [Perilla frutescens var. frutescens]KAH6793191.1 Ubiquitin-conjugating enzyme family protein [Perilla frutescens var. hirtella]
MDDIKGTRSRYRGAHWKRISTDLKALKDLLEQEAAESLGMGLHLGYNCGCGRVVEQLGCNSTVGFCDHHA